MVLAVLTFVFASATMPKPAAADTEDEAWIVPTILLVLVDAVAVTGNTVDVLQGDTSAAGGVFGVAAGAVTLGYTAAFKAADNDNPSWDELSGLLIIGGVTAAVGTIALLRRNHAEVSLQPQRILGHTTAAAVVTFHF
jgi:ABC-type cobalamin transport system permease subunit